MRVLEQRTHAASLLFVRFSHWGPSKKPILQMGFLLGDRSSEMLAPIYAEFQRWRSLIGNNFLSTAEISKYGKN